MTLDQQRWIWLQVLAASIAQGLPADKSVVRANAALALAVAAYPNTGSPSDLVPLYRLQGHGDHFYTCSAEERDSAVANYGYTFEGIACYVKAP